MSELEKLVRNRMSEEYAKGSSAEEISRTLRQVFNGVDPSVERSAKTAPKSN
jgi:hypothetical protein